MNETERHGLTLHGSIKALGMQPIDRLLLSTSLVVTTPVQRTI